jgi:hypothetical protein
MPRGNIPRRAVRQARRRRHSYCATIERRAAMAAGMIKQSGWSTRQAAGAFCVNAAYLGLARQLNDDDRLKLARGELKLSALWRNYRERLAARRKAPQLKRQRLLYRRADTLTDADLAVLVAEVGVERIWRTVDKITQPQLPLVAAE